jgi:hypothetical protein
VPYNKGFGTGYCNINGRPVGLHNPYRNPWPSRRRRKNISEEKEVFELITNHPKAFIFDPVCRMIIPDAANAVQHPEIPDTLFFSDHCMDIYRRNKEVGDN